MKLRTLLPILLVGVAACDSAKAPPKADWKAFSDAYIEATFKADPYFAVYQGRHEYDGILPDWSKAGIDAEIARLKTALADAQALDTSASPMPSASSATIWSR